MARQTSIDTYRKIESEGLLSKARWSVYKILFNHGPLTRSEIDSRMRMGMYKSHVSARLVELRQSGSVKEVGYKVCNVSNQTVILWDVTTELPVKIKKPTKIKCEHCNGKGHFIQDSIL